MAESPGNRIASTIARLSPKQRQLLILGLGGSVFAVLIFGGVALWDQPTTLPEGTPPVRPQPLPISAPGAQADPRDIWMSKSSEQMRQMEEMIQGLRQQVDLIERKPPPNPVLQALPPQPLPSPPPVIEPLNLPPLPPLPPLPANPGAGMNPDGRWRYPGHRGLPPSK
jgi:conjugal transfer pilus assembly protein TraB